MHFLEERAAHSLNNITLNLVLEPIGIGDQTAVVRYGHSFYLHFSSGLLDFDFRDRCHDRAVTIGDGNAAANAGIGISVRRRGRGPLDPSSLLRGGQKNLAGTLLISRRTQPELNSDDSSVERHLIDKGFTGKRAADGARRAKIACPQVRHGILHPRNYRAIDSLIFEGVHVAATRGPVFVAIPRETGTIGRQASLSGSQQREAGTRRVRKIPVREIPCRDLSLRIDSGTNGHQLRAALRLPGVFLVAHTLHANRFANRTGEKRGVFRYVVRAEPSITSRSFGVDDAHIVFWNAQKVSNGFARSMRALRSRPDRGLAVANVGHRAGGANHAVHMKWPMIGSLEDAAGAGQRRIKITAVGDRLFLERLRLLQIGVEVIASGGKLRVGIGPFHFQLL